MDKLKVRLWNGKMVNVWEDPITCQKLEGVGEFLVHYGWHDMSNGLVRALVRFKGEGDFERILNIDHL